MPGRGRASSASRLTLAFDANRRRGVSRMSQDDVLFGYRLQLVDYAGRTSVSEACRVFGVHRSTYYVWKRRIERHGLEILRPRERRGRRGPKQPSALPGGGGPPLPPRPPPLRARRGAAGGG